MSLAARRRHVHLTQGSLFFFLPALQRLFMERSKHVEKMFFGTLLLATI